VAGTRNARLLRRTLLVSVVVISGSIAAAPMAAADPCPVLDLGCVLQDTTTTAGGVLEDTTTTVGGVLEDTTTTVGGVLQDTTTTVGGVLQDTTTTVGGVLEDTTTTVGGVLQDTTTTVGDVLHGATDDPGTILDGVVPGVGGNAPGTQDPTPGGTRPGGSTPTGGGGDTAGGTPQQGEPTGVVTIPPASVVTLAGDATTTAGRPIPSFLDDRTAGALTGADLVRTVAFPLVLIVLVIGFVFVQDRIDRKDPKLTLAPVGTEYLTFA
jgi:hypothetical protein